MPQVTKSQIRTQNYGLRTTFTSYFLTIQFTLLLTTMKKIALEIRI